MVYYDIGDWLLSFNSRFKNKCLSPDDGFDLEDDGFDGGGIFDDDLLDDVIDDLLGED